MLSGGQACAAPTNKIHRMAIRVSPLIRMPLEVFDQMHATLSSGAMAAHKRMKGFSHVL